MGLSFRRRRVEWAASESVRPASPSPQHIGERRPVLSRFRAHFLGDAQGAGIVGALRLDARRMGPAWAENGPTVTPADVLVGTRYAPVVVDDRAVALDFDGVVG